MLCYLMFILCVMFDRYMMCSSAAELHESSHWEGKGPVSRQKLIENLQGNL